MNTASKLLRELAQWTGYALAAGLFVIVVVVGGAVALAGLAELLVGAR